MILNAPCASGMVILMYFLKRSQSSNSQSKNVVIGTYPTCSDTT